MILKINLEKSIFAIFVVLIPGIAVVRQSGTPKILLKNKLS